MSIMEKPKRRLSEKREGNVCRFPEWATKAFRERMQVDPSLLELSPKELELTFNLNLSLAEEAYFASEAFRGKVRIELLRKLDMHDNICEQVLHVLESKGIIYSFHEESGLLELKWEK